ncbi:MAG: hypothetical protein J0H74_16225 [Chitinophagaceae bacterium]|nr:hypothetical protein [Chitinophagaceae bacterium]
MSKIFDENVDKLVIALEEGTRAGKGNVPKFIEPAVGTLSRALSKRHHIIFGRRGSGKSSLLFKSADDLAKTGNPVAFIDLEPFKGHHYPDIIISVLIATFQKYSIWLTTEIEKDRGKRLWYTFFILKKYPENRSLKLTLQLEIDQTIIDLRAQLNLNNDAMLVQRVSEQNKEANDSKFKVGTDMQAAKLETAVGQTSENTISKEVKEEFRRNKQDYLLKKMLDFQHIFASLYSINNRDSYLFLDDLYHLVRVDQPDLIDYFHRISKGNNLWLKIGTIRNRTTWYKNTPQPTGVKLGDDADEIDLDLTLEKFSLSKSFLKSILNTYIQEAKAPKVDELLTDGAIERLVLASGGVTRDFLGLFRRSILEAKERVNKSGGKSVKGDKISAEDINIAAGTYGELKKDEFQMDAVEDKDRLESAFSRIKQFCLDKTKSNIFLIAQDASGTEVELIYELIDLRLIHYVKSRVTISGRKGLIYKGYLLDVSQYTGERTRKDIETIEFWKDSEKEKLRRASLIYINNGQLRGLKGKEKPSQDDKINAVDEEEIEGHN